MQMGMVGGLGLPACSLGKSSPKEFSRELIIMGKKVYSTLWMCVGEGGGRGGLSRGEDYFIPNHYNLIIPYPNLLASKCYPVCSMAEYGAYFYRNKCFVIYFRRQSEL